MDLSTALSISLFFYAVFLILLGIEYFTDKRRKERAPPQKSASETQKPQRKKLSPLSTSEHLEDKEATEKEEPLIIELEPKKEEEKTEAPEIWREEEFE